MKSKFIILSQIIAGITLMVLNIGIWINGLFIHKGDGMDIALAFFLLVIGAVLLLGWYTTSRSPRPSIQKRWKFILRVLLFNYIILYGLYMIPDIIKSDPIDFFTMPGILFPVLLGIFIVGSILSWRHELFAGILFIAWYGLVFYGTFMYNETFDNGPHVLFGVVILLQGIFYLYYHFRLRPIELQKR